MIDDRQSASVIAADEIGGDAETADLVRRHRDSLFPSVALNYSAPLELRRGEGQFVYDAAGKQYPDFFSGIATVSTRASRAQPGDDAAEAEQSLLHQFRDRGERSGLLDRDAEP